MAAASLVLNASRLKWLLVAAIGLGFVSLTGMLIADGERSWQIYGGGGFFALVFLVAVAVLLSRNRLEIDPEGFTFVHFGRRTRTAWADVSGFRAGPMGMVCFELIVGRHGAARVTSRWPGALPDTYGMSSSKLAALMEDWRRRAPPQGTGGA